MIAKEYVIMLIKTNRITFFFSILSLSLGLAIAPVSKVFGQVAGSPKSPVVESPKSQKKRTPEERAAEKQRQLALQNEMVEERQRKFGILPEGDDSELGREYQKSYERLRLATVELNEVQLKYHLATDFSGSFQDQINLKWQEGMHQCYLAKAEWLDAGAKLFFSDNEKYITIGESLCEMLVADVELDRTDGWLEATKAIVSSKKFERIDVLKAAILVAFANTDFDFTEECLTLSKQLDPQQPQLLLTTQIELLREKWKRELEIRKQEAEKNDNPRVEFVTTKGRVVVELFEDSAPETVKSFIFLVERGFYNQKSFFRVEKHVVVQTGCEKGDGTGDAGYTIPSEADRPNHRDHFRGSLAIALGTDAKTGETNSETGSSQIYFPFLPMPNLDGKHTVFGRVVECQETLGFFRVINLADEKQRKEEKQPDIILNAKVLRKRSTEYRPKIIAGKLPK